MGGKGSMQQWVAAGMAQNDHVHFVGMGYHMLGDALVRDLMSQYDLFLKARGGTLAAKAAASSEDQPGHSAQSPGDHPAVAQTAPAARRSIFISGGALRSGGGASSMPEPTATEFYCPVCRQSVPRSSGLRRLWITHLPPLRLAAGAHRRFGHRLILPRCRRCAARSGSLHHPASAQALHRSRLRRPSALTLRCDLGTKSQIVATAKHGDRLEVLETRRRFVKVRIGRGRRRLDRYQPAAE